jgi:hypothetical protein
MSAKMWENNTKNKKCKMGKCDRKLRNCYKKRKECKTKEKAN